MRNGRVPGKRWIATSGKYRFKLTIQSATEIKPEQVAQRLQKLPAPYMLQERDPAGHTRSSSTDASTSATTITSTASR